jgi:uncharacterized BrkB/YihY/UPF0761 family membrane protein
MFTGDLHQGDIVGKTACVLLTQEGGVGGILGEVPLLLLFVLVCSCLTISCI